MRSEYDYVYRVDYLETERGAITQTLGKVGHLYVNPLVNFPALTESTPDYLREMYGYKAGLAQAGQEARGLYLFSALDGARRMQASNLCMTSWWLFGQEGMVSSDSKPEALLWTASVVSRVKVTDLPEGTFFPDPNPQDSPKAVVHIVGQRGVVIPPENIELFIDKGWQTVTRADLEQIVAEAKSNNIERILAF